MRYPHFLLSLCSVIVFLGCDSDVAFNEQKNYLGINDIAAFTLHSNSEKDKASIFEVDVQFSEPILLDLCYLHNRVNHLVELIDDKGETLFSMKAQDIDYSCSLDKLDFLELEAGIYTIEVTHDQESNKSYALAIAFAHSTMIESLTQTQENKSLRSYVSEQVTDSVTITNTKVLGAKAYDSFSTVNDKITDSVTQANVKVLGDVHLDAIENLFEASVETLRKIIYDAKITESKNSSKKAYIIMSLYPIEPQVNEQSDTFIALNESMFVQDSTTRANDKHIVILHLESKIKSEDQSSKNDTALLGVDSVTFNFENAITTQLSIDTNSAVVIESMQIVDTQKNTPIAHATKGEKSKVFTLEANRDYTLNVIHDNSSAMQTIFVKFDNLFRAKGTKAANGVKENIQQLLASNSCPECNLASANLKGANLSGANLLMANLTHANLIDTDLSKAYLTYANLSKTYCHNTNFQNAYVDSANFSNALMLASNFSNAKVERANFFETNLVYTTFVDANCLYCDFTYANLNYANLSHSNLEFATFKYADLRQTNFSFAQRSRDKICAENSIGRCK